MTITIQRVRRISAKAVRCIPRSDNLNEFFVRDIVITSERGEDEITLMAATEQELALVGSLFS